VKTTSQKLSLLGLSTGPIANNPGDRAGKQNSAFDVIWSLTGVKRGGRKLPFDAG
jgi:hypothetical protein